MDLRPDPFVLSLSPAQPPRCSGLLLLPTPWDRFRSSSPPDDKSDRRARPPGSRPSSSLLLFAGWDTSACLHAYVSYPTLVIGGTNAQSEKYSEKAAEKYLGGKLSTAHQT